MGQHLQVFLLIVFIMVTSLSFAQTTDCVGATPLCGNITTTFNPMGAGADDFADPDNMDGCLFGENNSVWYTITMDAGTPANSILEFLLSSGMTADYDFAVFGPSLDCGNLGSPIRCSYAAGTDDTGLSASEINDPDDSDSNDLASALMVNAGETYHLVVDNWSGNGQAFDVSFSGSAANFIDCNGPCPITVMASAPQASLCPGTSMTLSSSSSNTSGAVTIAWSSTDGSDAWLSSTNSDNPDFSPPNNASGNFTLTYTVTDAICTASTTVDITVHDRPSISVTNTTNSCFNQNNGEAEIAGNNGIAPYTFTLTGPDSGTDSGTNVTFSNLSPGNYSVTLEDANGCMRSTNFSIGENVQVSPTIEGALTFCENGSTTLSLSESYSSYNWTPGGNSSTNTLSTTGTVSVLVTDADGCPGTASVDVTESDGIDFIISGQDYFCTGASTTIAAPPGYTTYTWSTTEDVESIDVNMVGTYTVTVIDASDCEGEASITISEAALPVPTIIGESVICGAGSLDLTVPEAFDEYAWSTIETGNSITVTNPNIYSVTVTDSNQCEGTTSHDVTLAPPIDFTIGGDFAYCPENGGTTLTGPAGYASYVWSNNQFGVTAIFVDSPGTYALTVEDADGCSGEASVEVQEFTAPEPTIDGLDAVCIGANADLTASAGFASYAWSTGDSGPVLNVTTANTYTVTVIDDNECSATVSHDFDIYDLPSPSIDGETEFCAGSDVTLMVTGGTFTEIAWSTSEDTESISVSSSADVIVTVTDANLCENSTSISVEENPLPDVEITGDFSICDNSSGTLSGTPGYATYLWSTNDNGDNITVTGAGSYGLTVTDSNDCSNNTSAEVDLFPTPEPEIDGDMTLCPGGGAMLSVIGNFAQYDWSDNQSSGTITVFNPGLYTVTVTDDNLCEGATSFEVEQVLAPEPEILGAFEICEGIPSPLSVDDIYTDYIWSTGGETSATETNGGGVYSLTVTDENGCMGEDELDVTEYGTPFPFITGPNGLCNGDAVDLEAEPGYETYLWNTDAQNSIISITEPGVYEVTVTTSVGCIGTGSIEVTASEGPPVTILGDQELCFGEEGNLYVEGDYLAVQWTTSVEEDEIFFTEPGTYGVTVTYLSGCTASNSVEVTMDDPIEVNFTGTPSFCPGNSTTIGTVENFQTYNWSTGLQTDEIVVDDQGDVTVEVTDATGCIAEATIFVEELTSPSSEITGDLSFCEGASTSLSAPDDLQYVWSNNATTQSITIDNTETIGLTVTDAFGCESINSVNVEETPGFSPSIDGDLTICEGQSTLLDAGNDFVEYLWSDQSTLQTLNTGIPGTYGLTVEDAAGCQGMTSVEVVSLENPTVEIIGDLDFCADGSSTLSADQNFEEYLWSDNSVESDLTVTMAGSYGLTVEDEFGCQGETSVEVAVFDLPTPVITGDLALCFGETTILSIENENYQTINWNDGSDSLSTEVVSTGLVNVEVITTDGCIGTAEVSVAINDEIQVSISGDDEICDGETTLLSVMGDFAAYTWSDEDDSDGATLEVNVAGMVSVLVEDEVGCPGEAMYEITVNDLPEVNIEGSLAFCPGGSTILSVADGFDAYIWSNNEELNTITVNAEDNYSVVVTDGNGCQNTDEVTVETQSELSPIINGTLDFCEGSETTLNAGDSFESYIWSNNANTNNIAVSTGGDFSVTVEDAFGCTGSTTVNVVMNTLPQPQINGDPFFCEGTSTLLSAGNYTEYQWSDTSSTAMITANLDGIYSVTVTDANNCQGETSVLVEELPLPNPQITGTLGFCPNQATILTAEAGFNDYQWSTGTSGAIAEVTEEGGVVLTVIDANNCEGQTEVNIAAFTVQEPQITGDLSFCPGVFATLEAPTGFVTTTWSNGSQEPTINIDTESEVSLFVVDNNSCETSTTVQVLEHLVTNPEITVPAGFCTGSAVLASIPDDYVSYQWNTGGTAPEITISQGGILSVDVLDANNCQSSALIAVEEYNLPTPQIGGSLTYCIGNSTTLNAGAIYTAYNWSSGDDFSEINVSNPGIVGLTVTDENGCIGNTTEEIMEATELSPVISGSLDFCEGQSTTLSVGSGFTTYNWSDGTDGPEITATASGIYNIVVEDNSGCSGQAEVTVVMNALPAPEILGNLAFCENEQTLLQLNQFYSSYQWSNTSPASEIIAAEPGEYSVTVTDENECTNEATVVVEQLSLPVFNIEGQAHFCTGNSAFLNVNENYANYQWSINPSQNQQSIEVQTSGIVGVTVTDNDGCESAQTISIAEIDLPIADAGSGFIINCFHENVVLGGAGLPTGDQYEYQWAGPGITSLTENILNPQVDSAGTYTLAVFDSEFGCLSELTQVEVVNQTNEPVVALEVLNAIDCMSSTALIDGSGSTVGSDIVYQWYDQGFEQIAGANDVLYAASFPGMFFLEVIDTISGCDNIQSALVEDIIDYPIAEAGEPQILNCVETNAVLDGSLSQDGLTIHYQWYTIEGQITAGASDENATVDEPGWYYIQVMDAANNCENIDSVYVSQNIIEPVAEAGPTQAIDCHNETAILNGAGSETGSNITYQWEIDGSLIPDATSLQLNVVTGGNYQLMVLNTENGCSAFDATEVTVDESAPQELLANLESPTCFGDEDGSIMILGANGGTEPYIYSFNGVPFTTQAFYNGLSAGEYQIDIEDANGCQLATSLIIEDGNDLTLDLGPDIYIIEGEAVNLEGEINIDENELVRIDWDSEVTLPCPECLVQEELFLQASTVFTLSVEDNNGCSTEDRVTVFVNNTRPVFIPTAFSPNGDNSNDIFFINGGSEVEKIKSFIVFNRWGESVFEIYNSTPNEPNWGWDGKYRGQPVNAAMYVFMAEIEFADGETILYTGEVAVMK